jgi:2-keto-4-pentenoate hydratase/2-oxohepta-3-ene-1,7-dioic acid hydratase in catechol pathway
MLAYRTPDGLARREGDILTVLDLPYHDVGALLADTTSRDNALTRLRVAGVHARIPFGEAKLLAPVARPERLVLVGANYADHVTEARMPTPDAPLFMLVVPDSGLTSPTSPVVLPAQSAAHVDFEGELAVILAAGGRHIPVDRAWQHIAGLTIVNDISARDVQLAAMQDGKIRDAGMVAAAKSFPTFKPLGPGVLIDPHITEQPDLALQTFVNNELRQSTRTSEMLFDLAEIIAYVSRTVELRPGDVILTGTPSGVGLADGRYLRAGDTVEVTVEGIGTLRNTVTVDEPAAQRKPPPPHHLTTG